MSNPKSSPQPGAPRPRRMRRGPPGFLTIAALAAVTSTPRSTLYHLVRNRHLPACTWRGRLIVPDTAVAELLAIVPLEPELPADNAAHARSMGVADGR